jgi:CopG family transcriptional regulator/antitoxin EndoAI
MAMPRTTKTITISLPPDMAEQVEKVRREEGRTKSELLREALRQYIQEREFRDIVREASKRNRELGITRDDVERLVDEYRAEKRQQA